MPLHVLVAFTTLIPRFALGQQTPPPAPLALAPSERLIQVKPNFMLQRGSLLVPLWQLERLVTDSPDALALARSADDHYKLGAILNWTGLGTGILGLVLAPVGAGMKNPGGSLSPAGVTTLATGLSLVAVSVGFFVSGIVIQNEARETAYQVINMYNRRLVDGQLGL